MRDRVTSFEVVLSIAPLDTVHVVDMARVIETIQDVPSNGSEPMDIDVAFTSVLERPPAFVPVRASFVTGKREATHVRSPRRTTQFDR